MIFYDVHTHNRVYKEENIISIISGSYSDDGMFYSVGIHPWYINHDYSEKLACLSEIANKPNVIAIGEIGLDKSCRTDYELQKTVYKEQLSIAKNSNKPAIIHCVKSFEDIFSLSKGIPVPLIMHGYCKGIELAHQLTDKGYYLSFGKSLFDNDSKSIRAFEEIPMSNIFLETDESDFRISDIYKRAAVIKGMETEALAEQIKDNFKKVFKTNGFK